MAWAIDTCVLIDVLDDDPDHGRGSAALLSRKLEAGLVICPLTYVELAPAFNGSPALEEEFLAGVGVDWRQPWTWQDTAAAHRAWAAHVASRRARRAPKRPIADVLIGAFAMRFEGFVTRNAGDFRRIFPSLPIAEP
jgi:predicted nucleic acid-binding protein